MTTTAVATTPKPAALVKMASGEYTAASVTADPTDAAKLGLTKQKDGNYGTAAMSATATAASSTSSGTLAAIAGLTLGGS